MANESTPSKMSKVTKVSKATKSEEKTPKKIESGSSSKIKVTPSVQKEERAKAICIIRVRSAHGMRHSIMDTLKLLNLHNVNHAIVISPSPSVLGMIQKAKDYIAYGFVDAEILSKMLKKRGLLLGNKPLTDSHVKFATEYDSIDSLAKAIIENKIKIRDVRGLKPVFRLHPPRGGFHGTIKKPITAGGVLGNHGDNIKTLIQKMI
jgi:large subunit ribosomal protein L30